MMEFRRSVKLPMGKPVAGSMVDLGMFSAFSTVSIISSFPDTTAISSLVSL